MKGHRNNFFRESISLLPEIIYLQKSDLVRCPDENFRTFLNLHDSKSTKKINDCQT